MDPQGNMTMSQGIDPDSLEKSMYDVLVYDTPIREVIRKREVDIACASIDLAGLGGNTNFYKPMVEGIWYLRQNSRMTLGMRGQIEYIHQFKGLQDLPIFEKLFLGGEYSVRGYDIR